MVTQTLRDLADRFHPGVSRFAEVGSIRWRKPSLPWCWGSAALGANRSRYQRWLTARPQWRASTAPRLGPAAPAGRGAIGLIRRPASGPQCPAWSCAQGHQAGKKNIQLSLYISIVYPFLPLGGEGPGQGLPPNPAQKSPQISPHSRRAEIQAAGPGCCLFLRGWFKKGAAIRQPASPA